MEKRVYWTDIPAGKMFWYDPATKVHKQFYEGRPVGGFTIQADGSLLLFVDKGAVAIWRRGKLEYVVEEITEECDSRFNDVIADPAGRVFCGTMATKSHDGKLYRLDTNGKITPVVEGVGVSNGMGFTPNGKRMYYTDSRTRRIDIFDYDQKTGSISNRRLFVQVPEGEGIPDGMTVDAKGYVWSARWDGYALYRYAPDGTMAQRVEFPTKKVSCVIFGGDDFTDMYVTTAGGHDKKENGADAGALFRLNLGVKGVPEFFSRVGP
jgi:D-xylonolactonase